MLHYRLVAWAYSHGGVHLLVHIGYALLTGS